MRQAAVQPGSKRLFLSSLTASQDAWVQKRTSDVRRRRLEQDVAQFEVAVQDVGGVQVLHAGGDIHEASVHLHLQPTSSDGSWGGHGSHSADREVGWMPDCWQCKWRPTPGVHHDAGIAAVW